MSTLLERYDRSSDMEGDFGNYNVGVGFKQVFEPQKRELTIDGRYSSGSTTSDMRMLRLFEMLAGEPVAMPPELTLNDIAAGNDAVGVQADHFRPVLGGRIDLGYRALSSSAGPRQSAVGLRGSRRNVTPARVALGVRLSEVFHSLYATLGRTFGKISAQLGLRAELSHTTFESGVADVSFDREYNTLDPSLDLSYNMRPGRTLRFLYSKRISRPPPYYLDSFIPAADPLNRNFGNPDLKPSYTQSFSLDLSWSGSKATFRIGPYYRRSTDVWERIRTVDTLGVATNRWENAAKRKPAARISRSRCHRRGV